MMLRRMIYHQNLHSFVASKFIHLRVRGTRLNMGNAYNFREMVRQDAYDPVHWF
ncbi:hypothetical protein Plhal304r1_c032g0102211 [Plasmopara halstedii]